MHTLTALDSTFQYEAVALTSNGDTITDVSFNWSSSDDSVATVNPVGLVTSNGDGEATIAVSAEEQTAEAKLIVDLPGERLVFATSPSDVRGQEPISPAVEVIVVDSAGNRETGSSAKISIAVENDPLGGHAVLSGSTTIRASEGVATFDHLSIDRPGRGFTVEATAEGLEADTTESFNVSLEFTEISAGRSHTCGVTTTNHAFCWGLGGNGQLGSEGPRQAGRPVGVDGGHEFAQITTGHLFTCGVTTTNELFCWGNNDFGQLGDGTTADRSTPEAVDVSGLPTRTFEVISAGWDFACALTTDGEPFCWGWNQHNQLGDGTTTDRLTPTAVDISGLSTPTFHHLSAGGGHACAITTAAEAVCWGHNSHGQLGDGSTFDRSTPVQVEVSGLPTPTFTQLTGGRVHTCGVTTEGEPFCWGWNEDSQLGDGTATDRLTPTAVDISGLSTPTFHHLSAGDDHTCGLSTADEALCWGRNDHGQLGDGTTGNRSAPVGVEVSGLPTSTFTELTGGGVHTCGVTTAGQAFCWGDNWTGQLGDGTTINNSTPVQVIQ